MRRSLRSLLIFSALALAACGFHPRGDIALAPGLQRVHVSSSDAGSPLKGNIEDALRRGGAAIEVNPGDGVGEVKMTGVGVTTQVASVGGNARVNEFNMIYHVDLEVSDGAGKSLLEKQPIEQHRTFTFDQTQAIGLGSVQDQIRHEMERDMTATIVRRIDAIQRRLAH
jgi:LPS-assembly lipoprotein